MPESAAGRDWRHGHGHPAEAAVSGAVVQWRLRWAPRNRRAARASRRRQRPDAAQELRAGRAELHVRHHAGGDDECAIHEPPPHVPRGPAPAERRCEPRQSSSRDRCSRVELRAQSGSRLWIRRVEARAQRCVCGDEESLRVHDHLPDAHCSQRDANRHGLRTEHVLPVSAQCLPSGPKRDVRARSARSLTRSSPPSRRPRQDQSRVSASRSRAFGSLRMPRAPPHRVVVVFSCFFYFGASACVAGSRRETLSPARESSTP